MLQHAASHDKEVLEELCWQIGGYALEHIPGAEMWEIPIGYSEEEQRYFCAHTIACLWWVTWEEYEGPDLFWPAERLQLWFDDRTKTEQGRVWVSKEVAQLRMEM